MPHIKLKSTHRLKEIWNDLPKFEYSIEDKGVSFKFCNAYIRKDEKEILYEFVVVEGRLVQTIFVSLSKIEDYYLLKLKKNYPVLKTYGVKILILIIGLFLKERDFSFYSTNLEHLLSEAEFYYRHIFL